MKFKAIDGTNWLRKPWKRMSHNDYYRHYVKRTDTYEENLVVVRTSDKCYRVTRWKVYFTPYPKPSIYAQSFRSWGDVAYYASREIR
ncbi:MAG: hypothetical protein K2L70_04470 [Clostridia bacterium]|nr:hypothetical protein [Clostridia bacterium]